MDMDISMDIHGKSVDMDKDGGISYPRQAWTSLTVLLRQTFCHNYCTHVSVYQNPIYII